jgi:archaemetzincin
MNFVFGVAMQSRAIVSSFRTGEKLIPKEVVHEVGHIFGLSYCKNYCVMQFSNSVMKAIAKPDILCEKYERKLAMHQNLF